MSEEKIHYTPREIAYLAYKDLVEKAHTRVKEGSGKMMTDYEAKDVILEILMLCYDFGEEVQDINLHLGDMLRTYLRPSLEEHCCCCNPDEDDE